jgi:hypothetical protein
MLAIRNIRNSFSFNPGRTLPSRVDATRSGKSTPKLSQQPAWQTWRLTRRQTREINLFNVFLDTLHSVVVKIITFLVVLLPLAGFGVAEASPPNWSGNYAPCNLHSDLLNPHHMDLAVRMSSSNPVLSQQFASAMDFWAGVLDLDWHEVNSQDCAIQLVDGTPALFDFCLCMSAKSQFPDRADFQGWIAFNPRLKLTKQEMFVDSVHEIGHLLGLPHNPSDSSVMFYSGRDKAVSLNAADLDILAARHQLRPEISYRKNGTKDVRVSLPGQTGARGGGWHPGTSFSALVKREFGRSSFAASE